MRTTELSTNLLAIVLALAAVACNAAAGAGDEESDAAPIDAGDDTATDILVPDGGLPLDTDLVDATAAPCDPFEDQLCPCANGVTVSCYAGPAGSRDRGGCSPGQTTCVNGTFGECVGQALPQDEFCDDLDNDCDGRVDEGVSNACGGCGDEPAELCGDWRDNDCDGVSDESAAGCDCDDRTNQPCYEGPPGTGGMGTCVGGITSCVAGDWLACAGQVLPGEEVCNGTDDDCDGGVDEGLRNACGECGPAPAELCDHLDNDCDGLADEGVRLPCGACVGEVPDEDICGDGFDNDCDGVVDDGCPCVGEESCYPGDPVRAGVGTCALGSRVCEPSGEFWGECTGWVLPAVEVCDGLDNDCDGVTDLDVLGCSVCASTAEICNDLDDDCDGVTDEGTRNSCGDCLIDVVPEEAGGAELCNGADDDCDGLTDEGLLNACGSCDDSCYISSEEPDETDALDDGAEIIGADDEDNPTGRPGVTLSSQTFIPPFLWSANHTNQTASRFNIETNAEEGRYWVADNPSRTAVDLDGNVWIAGRNDGRLTKILWNIEDCPDRNGNGVIDTSRPGALGPINSSSNPLADECVVYSEVTNPDRRSIRGVAAGPDGRVWIGYSGAGIQSIDPHTFELGPFDPGVGVPVYRATGSDYRPAFNPDGTPELANIAGVYGLVVDSTGLLYLSSYNRTQLARFDTMTGEWDAMFVDWPGGLYGIALDGRNRVWTGGHPTCRGVGMFDPETGRAHTFCLPDGFTPRPGAESGVAAGSSGCGSPNMCVTGVAAQPATGDIWASFYSSGYTGRLTLNEDDLTASTWHLIGTTRNDAGDLLPGVSNDLRGVGFDRNGFAWTIGLGSDRVWKIDPETNRRSDDLPTGVPIGVGTHYTYSDFTGSTALTFTAPRALWSYLFDAGYPAARVDAIEWQAYVPPNTAAGLRVRVLDPFGEPLTEWVPAEGYSPYPEGLSSARIELSGAGLEGQFFEVEVNLSTSDVDIRPIVHRVDTFWQRP